MDHPESPQHPELVFRLRAVPAAVFVDLLRHAGEALDARALKTRLAGLGVARDVVDVAWRRAQPGVKRHANVAVDASGRYAWSDRPVPREPIRATPTEAWERILRGRLPAGIKADLAELVLRALRERDVLEQQARATYESAREARTALERQMRIDAVRSVADIAAEVEELAGRADPGVLVERVRALAKAFDLDPIGHVGDLTAFDPLQHEPIGGQPLDGTPVMIIRPGYSWRTGPHAVLLGKAQVTGV